MGRYYNGDINGKFWFAIQGSAAADRFGVSGFSPNYLQYYFDQEDLPSVIEELDSIRETLGKYFDVFEKFFKENKLYNDQMFIEQTGIEEYRYRFLLSEYADYHLGLKIKESIEKIGQCEFDAEQ